MKSLRALVLVLGAVFCIGAAASDPTERLPNPAQEARARNLFRQVRCLVCQNESIDDSEADLAADLRHIVREQIVQGRSDSQVKAFLTDRYGEFVLFKPRFSPGNAGLWLTPFVIIGAGGALLLFGRKRGRTPEPPLNPEEMQRLAELTHSPSAVTVPPHGGSMNAQDG